MTSTSESATGTNKRRRTAGSQAIVGRTTTATRAAVPTTTATADPRRLLGTRLEPIMEVLVLQPESLQTHIISSCNEMLDLIDTINQRETSHTRFSQPMTNAQTGEVLKDGAGEPKTFVPNSCRDSCPIKASKQKNDDPEMKDLLDAADEEHEAYKQSMARHAKLVSEKEISLRHADLKKAFFTYVKKVTHVSVATIQIMNKGLGKGMKLSIDELTHKTAYDLLGGLSEESSNRLGFECSEVGSESELGLGSIKTSASAQLADAYAKVYRFNNAATRTKAAEEDNTFVCQVIVRMSDLVITTTVGLWKIIEDQEQQREIEAAIKLILEPPATQGATRQVQFAMEAIDTANPSKTLLDVIDKQQKAGFAKIRQEMKKEMRKNYSADPKNQGSTPTKNGLGSKKTSTATASSSKKQKQKKSQPEKTAASQQEGPSTRSRKAGAKAKVKAKGGKDQDSRGGSKGGARRKGAERR